MTNKTISNLKKLKSFHIHNGNYDPDIDRAIKAIEQQSNMVSRIAYEQVMWERDVAIEQLKELGYGLGEKIRTDGDTISRQKTIETFEKWICSDYKDDYPIMSFIGIQTILEEQPSVKPQEPKTGHWEWVQYNYNPQLGNWHCSECRCVVVECVGKEEKGGIPLYKYCPQCGAKMEVSE